MLFRSKVLDGIAAGRITAAFRRWRRPTVRAGGQLHTPAGLLSILSVEPIEVDAIDESDAERAGYASRSELLRELCRREDGGVYRIDFRHVGADPRIALREREDVGSDELREVVARLARFDAASGTGPWTRTFLELISDGAGVRAAELAPRVDMELHAFKRNVRKLKNLGLTISLGTGYRLSPRGGTVLARLREHQGASR